VTPDTVFADTSFYLALMRDGDQAHHRAVLESEIRRPIVTSEFIILELGNACARVADRRDFLTLVEGLRASPRVTIVPLDSGLLERGLQRMAERADKDWSLTDCISFIVMEDTGIHKALSADRHFEQAGFQPLLKE
jgi:predicted nucleic acid-binding protein